VRWLGRLELDTILLAVVVLTAVRVVVRRGSVWRSGLVVVIRLCVVCGGVVAGRSTSGSPASAVEGLATCATTATRGETAAEKEQKQKADNDHGEDDPADPVVPGGAVTVLAAIVSDIAIIVSSLEDWHGCDESVRSQ